MSGGAGMGGQPVRLGRKADRSENLDAKHKLTNF